MIEQYYVGYHTNRNGSAYPFDNNRVLLLLSHLFLYKVNGNIHFIMALLKRLRLWYSEHNPNLVAKITSTPGQIYKLSITPKIISKTCILWIFYVLIWTEHKLVLNLNKTPSDTHSSSSSLSSSRSSQTSSHVISYHQNIRKCRDCDCWVWSML